MSLLFRHTSLWVRVCVSCHHTANSICIPKNQPATRVLKTTIQRMQLFLWYPHYHHHFKNVIPHFGRHIHIYIYMRIINQKPSRTQTTSPNQLYMRVNIPICIQPYTITQIFEISAFVALWSKIWSTNCRLHHRTTICLSNFHVWYVYPKRESRTYVRLNV